MEPRGEAPTFEELYRGAALIRQKRESKLKELNKQRKEKELEGVTFKPKINNPRKPNETTSDNLDLLHLTSHDYDTFCTQLQAQNPFSKHGVQGATQSSRKQDQPLLYSDRRKAPRQRPTADPAGYASLAAANQSKASDAPQTDLKDPSGGYSPMYKERDAASKTISKASYLSQHLNKRTYAFTRVKEEQESKILQLSKVSENLLNELKQQKKELYQDGAEGLAVEASLDSQSRQEFMQTPEGFEKEEGFEQFVVIERFLKKLSLEGHQLEMEQ